jgi:hypothetical protein
VAHLIKTRSIALSHPIPSPPGLMASYRAELELLGPEVGPTGRVAASPRRVAVGEEHHLRLQRDKQAARSHSRGGWGSWVA